MKKLHRVLCLIALATASTSACADPLTIALTLSTVLSISVPTAIAIVGFVEAYGVYMLEVAVVVYGAVAARRRAAQAAARARDQYNSNLIDRISTVVAPNPPWRVVYGNCITGGDIVAIFTSDKTVTRSDGSQYVKPDAYKHLVIHVATHQIEAFHDTIVAGIRLGPLDSNGWVNSFSGGTGEGYSISSTCNVGETQIPLAGGTGTVLVGDSISFVGDPTRYTVVNNPGVTHGGITGSGQTLTIASPGLVVLTPAGTTVDLGHEFATPQTGTHTIIVPASGSVTVPTAIHTIISATYSTGGTGDTNYATPTLSTDKRTITNTIADPITVTYSVIDIVPMVRVSYHLGTPDQTVDTYLNLISPIQWDSTHRLQGIAYAVVTLDLEDVRFQGGPPQIAFDVSGALVYDPRSNTTAFSSNNALIIRDFLTKPYGFNCAGSDVDDSYTIAGANVCDTTTTFSSVDVFGHTVTQNLPQYTANGAFTTADSMEATLTNLAVSMAGTCAYGGQWMIMPGAWSSSVMDLTDDDLAGQISVVQAGAGLDELFNGCHASFMPVNRMSPQDITPYQNTTFVAADGEELWSDFTFPWTDSEVRVRNLCRIFVEKNRNGMVIQYPAKLKAFPLRVGDRVRVSSGEYGFSLKYFRVTDWQFGVNTPVTLTLEEDGADAYDQADAVQADPTPNTQLPSPFKVGRLQNFAITTGTTTLLKQTDGTIVPRILVTWDVNTSAYVSSNGQIEIAWRLEADTAWNLVLVDGNDTQAFITGIRSGTLVIVRGTVINSLLRRSDAVYESVIVVGKEAPPVDVAGLTLANTTSGVQVSWTPNTEVDYLETEVHIESSIVWNPATVPVFRGSSNTFILPFPAAGIYNFVAKHRDTSGNISSGDAYLTFTVVPISGGGVAASIVGQGDLATLNTVDTGQIDPGAVTDFVEVTAGGPVHDIAAYPHELVRVSYGPYAIDVSVDITVTGYCTYKWDSAAVGPISYHVGCLLSDNYSGDGPSNISSQSFDYSEQNSSFSLTRSVVLPAGTTSFARLIGGQGSLGGSGGYADWYALDIKAVVRKR